MADEKQGEGEGKEEKEDEDEDEQICVMEGDLEPIVIQQILWSWQLRCVRAMGVLTASACCCCSTTVCLKREQE